MFRRTTLPVEMETVLREVSSVTDRRIVMMAPMRMLVVSKIHNFGEIGVFWF